MKQISISNNSTIKSAIAKLSKEGVGTLLVVDKNNSFLGTLSDGFPGGFPRFTVVSHFPP